MFSPMTILWVVTPWLAVLCYWDCRYRRLPNPLTFGAMAVALVWRLGMGGTGAFLDGVSGGVLCGLFLLLPFLLKGAGGGDLKMMCAAGCLLGTARTALMLLATSLSGCVLACVMLLAGWADGKRLKHYFRCLFDWRYDRKAGREQLPPPSDERNRLPFGVAIALGVWITLIFEIYGKGGNGA